MSLNRSYWPANALRNYTLGSGKQNHHPVARPRNNGSPPRGRVLTENALVLEVDEKASYMLKLQTHNRQILSVQLQSLNSAQTARYCYDDYDYGVEFFGKVAAMS